MESIPKVAGNWQYVYEGLLETVLGIHTLQVHTAWLLSESHKGPSTDRSKKLRRLSWERSWPGLLPSGDGLALMYSPNNIGHQEELVPTLSPILPPC